MKEHKWYKSPPTLTPEQVRDTDADVRRLRGIPEPANQDDQPEQHEALTSK
jgi:hypothetical protein